LMFRKLHTSW